MFNQNFIFSEKKSVRIKRHLLFWTCWWLYFGILHAVNPFGKPDISFFRNLPFTTLESLLLLFPQIIITYYMIYFILPNYLLRNKYWQAFLWIIPAWFICGVINLYLVKHINPKILALLLPPEYLVNTQRPPAVSFFMALLSTYKGAFTVAAFAVGIKFIKHWYLKEQRNMQLQKENTEAQLQLLTAQVHPHFLFNTLNNIYSQTQTESLRGSKMIMELSDMLRYILSEGHKPLVPLNKELSVLMDYINLEKVRYGNKLDLHVAIPEESNHLLIAPLLLLPFVENCFKHGSSKLLRNPWINLKIEIKNNLLFMKLMNGKDTDQQGSILKSGIGIINVKQRLELLYKDKYELQVTDEPEVFVVNLKLELIETREAPFSLNEPSTEFSYA